MIEIKKQGTIREYFSNIQIPKECGNTNLVGMEVRKRKVEVYGMVEHYDGSSRKKTRRTTMNPEHLPMEMTIPDGNVRNLGAKSFYGREPEDNDVLGAWELCKLDGIKKDESGRLPGDLGKVEENCINTHR